MNIGVKKSLTALGDVFSAIAEKKSHKPYQRSTLTKILHSCFERGKTLFLVNVRSSSKNIRESNEILKLASKTKPETSFVNVRSKKVVADGYDGQREDETETISKDETVQKKSEATQYDRSVCSPERFARKRKCLRSPSFPRPLSKHLCPMGCYSQ